MNVKSFKGIVHYGTVVALFVFGAANLFSRPQASTSAPPPKPYRERLLERAQKGDADAQYELGKDYETGRIGLPKDISQAEFWYRKGADQGDPYSEASLGILFNFGKGVKADYVQAYMWYERAISHSDGGNGDSIVELRDNLAQKMTPKQIEEAKQLAKEWKHAAKK